MERTDTWKRYMAVVKPEVIISWILIKIETMFKVAWLNRKRNQRQLMSISEVDGMEIIKPEVVI